MATSYGPVIRRSLGKAIANPIAAAKVFRRRLFPFGIVPTDPEAYRIGSWSYGALKREPAAEVFPPLRRHPCLSRSASAADRPRRMALQKRGRR
jgi:hypothetical protein